MRSFKLLQDCPASNVFIFQTYRPLVNEAITIFVPLVFDFIQLQAEPQRRKHESMESGKSWVGICPEIPKEERGAFQDMVMAQTKTMSFLAYIHRVSNTALSSYRNVLPEIAIDTLLDEHVLTGNSVTGHENLRPLAFSMLTDLIHHCRAELTLPQLSRVVHTYCANVHDPTLASAIQTMCSKLLLNLIDPIVSKEPSEAVKILQRILLAFVSRTEAMAEVRDEWSKWSKAREPLPALVDKVRTREKERAEWTKRQLEKGKGKAVETDGDEGMQVDDAAGKEGSEAMQVDGPEASTSAAGSKDAAKAPATEGDAKPEPKKKDENEEPAKLQLDDVDIERAKPIKKAVVMVDPGPDPIKDARFLFRNLLFGFKTLGLALNRMGGLGPDAEMMCRFFDAAVKCMVLFDPARDQGREQKDVSEVLTTTLVQTELVIFQEAIENRMGFFFDELIRDHELLVIPQSLLSNENVSQHFVAILFRFLSAHLPDLGNSNKENTSVMLRLYKMSFMAVTIFPEKNEPVLLPHLSNLIMNSLKLASQAADPNSYYLLLRALFRCIGGGRFRILYNEVLPFWRLSHPDRTPPALRPPGVLPMFATNRIVKRVVCLTVDHAIREIIALVVERSVTIAGISTRELTMKDFAMDGDEGKVAAAAHLMVQSLAGSLALVTCKEPLRLSMVAHVRILLLQNGFADENLPEQIVLFVVAENLDLAGGVVDHRERSREAFWDTAARWPLLTTRACSPTLFASNPAVSPLPSSRSTKTSPASAPRVLPSSTVAMARCMPTRLRWLPPLRPRRLRRLPRSLRLSGPQVMEKFGSLIAELDKALAAEAPASALTGVAQDGELRRLSQQIPLVAASSLAIDETPLTCSQKGVQLLYRSETTLARDTYVFLLDRMCAILTKVAKEVTLLLIYAEDECKFNVPVTVALLQSRFIKVAELDLQLAKSVVPDFQLAKSRHGHDAGFAINASDIAEGILHEGKEESDIVDGLDTPEGESDEEEGNLIVAQDSISHHVVDVQSVTACKAVERADQLRRAGGVAQEDAETIIRSTRWAKIHELADAEGEATFAAIIDAACSRPAVIESASRPFATTRKKKDAGTTAASGKHYGWSLKDVSLDVPPPAGNERRENIEYREPTIDTPQVVAYLAASNISPDQFFLWTNDESVVMHAARPLVRWIAFEEASQFIVLDLDVIVRDRYVGLSNTSRRMWQAAFHLVSGHFLPKLPGLGPYRLNQNANLLAVCAASDASSDNAAFEKKVRAALKDADAPSLQLVFDLLTLESINTAISFETGEVEALDTLAAIRSRWNEGQGRLDLEFRQQLAGADQNLIVLYRDPLPSRAITAGSAPASPPTVASLPQERSSLPTEVPLSGSRNSRNVPSPTEMAAAGADEAERPVEGDDDDDKMADAPTVSYGPANPLDGVYAGKKRPINVEVRRTGMAVNPVEGAKRKADRYRAKLADGAQSNVSSTKRRPKRSTTDRKTNAAELLGTIVPRELRRACKARGRRAARDSNDSDSAPSSDSDSASSEESQTDDDDDDHDDDVVVANADTDTDKHASGSGAAPNAAQANHPQSDAQATASAQHSGLDKKNSMPSKKAPAASRDAKPVKKQFGFMTVQTDYMEAYRRVAILDRTSVDEASFEELKNTDSCTGRLDHETGAVKIKVGNAEATALTLDKDLRILDQVVQQQSGYEMRALVEVLRRAVSKSLTLHPSHGFLEQLGLGFDPNDRASNRFRRLSFSVFALMQEKWQAPSNTSYTASWRMGREGVAERRANAEAVVQARQLAGLPAAAAQRAAELFRPAWRKLSDKDRELLAQLDLPLFVLDAAEEVHQLFPTAFSSMPGSVYYRSLGQCFTATVTALYRNLGRELDQLGRRLLLGFRESGPEFIDYVGEPFGIDLPTTLSTDAWSAATSEAWSAATADSAIAKRIEERVLPFVTAAITSAPLVGDISVKWRQTVHFHIAIGLRSSFERFAEVEKGGNKHIGDIVGESIVEMLSLAVRVLQAQYGGIARRWAASRDEEWSPSPEEIDAQIDDWFQSTKGLVVDASGLLEAVAGWRHCFRQEFALTYHGTSLAVPMIEQLRRIKHAPDSVGALIENMNHAIDAANQAVKQLPQDEVESLRGKILKAIKKPEPGRLQTLGSRSSFLN
ncbi:hypothetical protein JCM10908_006015 [Rhodotorula pacifica]|uniref:uncharacterized protein n=1 Tax=Rhodotorula pacifica TaxID=1495444 RepID=UPI003182104D